VSHTFTDSTPVTPTYGSPAPNNSRSRATDRTSR
jgi:hypothetical protein